MLRENETISRQELAVSLDLTPASLSRIAKELIDQGICIEAPISRESSQRGRPSVALQINADGGYLIAVSISSYTRIITVIDIIGKRHYEQQIPKDILTSAQDTISFIGSYVNGLVGQGHIDKNRIIGLAFTVPGSINSETGFLTKSVYLDWPNFPIKERLMDLLDCPVRVENIGDALCLNFLDSCVVAGRLKSSVFLAHVSAGMGASIAIGGQIVRRLADEGWINDIIVPANDDDANTKTKLSQLASGRAIVDRLSNTTSAPEIVNADFNEKLRCAVSTANSEENSARDEFFNAGRALGANLVPLTIAYAPDTIVLAGPVLGANSYFDGVMAGYKRTVEQMDIQPSTIVVSSANYVDAAESLALQDFFHSGAYGSQREINGDQATG